jgi:hypothetical protein
MSQATRKITYASVNFLGDPKVTYSSATTWGELKTQEQDLAANSVGYKVFITEPKTELTNNNQALPEGDFSIVFLLDKNNSGNNGIN